MKTPELKLENVNKPTSAKWSKIAAVFALAATILGSTGAGTESHILVYGASACSFASGAILILINGKQ